MSDPINEPVSATFPYPSTSILASVKKVLGLDQQYDVFDQDIILDINGVFSTLNQLGIGPVDGFEIEGYDSNWADFTSNDPRLNSVRSYVCLRVRLLFDPPTTSFHISAMQDQIKEIEWRINVYRESAEWVDPNVDYTRDGTRMPTVVDGGIG